MLMHILAATPKWVFALFLGLLLLGLQQMRPRQIGLLRATLLPLGMTGFSLYGVASVFGGQPLVFASWLAGLLLVGGWVASRPAPAGTRFDAQSGQLHVPGSGVPLALMMGIFFTKFAVGVSLAISPMLAQDTHFAWALAALYGAFSGIFVARATRLVQMVLRPRALVLRPA